MDRQIVYPGAIPLETDLLNSNKYGMIGLSKLAAAILGTSTLVNGLAVSPDSPASLNVSVGAGEIYSLQNVDGTAYSSLAADTTHQIVKQGLRMDAGLLSCPAPGTVGQSINYLIQATYTDTDSGATVAPYYNASNPAQAYSGPNNSGTAQNTVRKGVCTVSAKAGAAATTGTQTTPSPDSGYVGLAVVTVANGQSTITAGNIAIAANVPQINTTLLGLSPAFSVSPTAPTPTVGDNSTKLATTAFVQSNVGKQIRSIFASVASNALTVGLNQTSLDFRSTTLTDGTVNTRSVGSTISVVVPSTATLGTANATAARLAILAIDNAGTVELGVVNLAGGNNLDETTLISTTAMSAAATAPNVIYSTTARTNVPFRVVGFVDITEATAGTWATAPSTVQGVGGQALSALGSLGYGQTWQTMNASRAAGTTYTNTTGRPICVQVDTSTATTIELKVSGMRISYSPTNSSVMGIVPPGATYVVTASAVIDVWAELR